MNKNTAFGNKRGTRCTGYCCKVSKLKNGQCRVTIPSAIVRYEEIKKGDILKFTDEGVWIKVEKAQL